LFVQKRRDLTDALSITPAYLRNQFSDSGLVTDYRDWQIPLGRRFRSLKIWFVIRTWGVGGLRQHIRSHLRLGDTFADLVRSRSDLFTILVQPRFALTVLAVNPRRKQHHEVGDDENSHAAGTDPRPYELQHLPLGASEPSSQEIEQANEITKEVYTAIDARKDFFLTASVVGDTYAIRVVSANPLAEEKYVQEVFGQLVEEAEKAFQRPGM
ncbi:hypothetical protein KC336_g17572, partial [Hortaea werneckii]